MKGLMLGSMLVAAGFSVPAGEVRLASAGVRLGTSINNRSETFRQIDATVDFHLPWRWEFGGDWRLATRFDLSAGWLHGEGKEGVIGTLGPAAVFGWRDFPVTLESGTSPTFLSRHHFSERDFGGFFQFTSHIGASWNFAEHWELRYRYQHMSNAGLASPNPGLNLHTLGISWRF